MPRSAFTLRTTAHRREALVQRAVHMRHAPTASEARLFEAVRAGKLGVEFRRQVPLLGRFIVDLVAPEVRLVVEIDGGYHEARAHSDARRDRALVRAGYTVLHLDAALVMSDIAGTVARIAAEVARLRQR